MERYGDQGKNNEVFNMAVKPAWQRKGIMRQLHNIAEQHFGKINPSKSLSDDGFAFWKSYRPDAVKNSYRFYADKFIGQDAPTSSGIGKISTIGDRSMIATLPNGNTDRVNRDHAKSLFDQENNNVSENNYAQGGDVSAWHPNHPLFGKEQGGYIPHHSPIVEQALNKTSIAPLDVMSLVKRSRGRP